MAASVDKLVRRLSLIDAWVVAWMIFFAAWWVPQAYIGEYKPLFAANSLTLSRLAGYVVPGAAALFGICTLLTWARDKRPNAIGVDIALAFLVAYYLAWRWRTPFVANDEDKIVWLVTGAEGTLPLALASICLVAIRP